MGTPLFEFVSHDINKPLEVDNTKHVDFVVHLVSNTSLVTYVTDSIGTVIAQYNRNQ